VHPGHERIFPRLLHLLNEFAGMHGHEPLKILP
jgi:hypothetical protein